MANHASSAHDEHDDHGDHADDGLVHVHVHPESFYWKIFGVLIFLTVVTVATSYIDIDGFIAPGTPHGAGGFNLALAMVIAATKAGFVVTFFMHLKDDNRFNALVFVGSVLFAAIFLAYTLNDTNHRNDGDRFHGIHVLPSTGERAPGGVDHQFTFEEPEAGIERTEEFVPHHAAEGGEHVEGAAEGEPAGDAHAEGH